jgi:hypothetical protein
VVAGLVASEAEEGYWSLVSTSLQEVYLQECDDLVIGLVAAD